MESHHNIQLDYEAPQKRKKPSSYSVVVLILSSTFLIVFGIILVISFVSSLFITQEGIRIWQVIVLPFIVAFFWVGIATLLQVIRTLRGTSDKSGVKG